MLKVQENGSGISAFSAFHLLAILLLNSIVKSESSSSSSVQIPASDANLIETSSLWFGDSGIHGFEVFVRRFNSSAGATVFISEHMSDHQITHNGSDDKGHKLVLLPGHPETTVPYKNVTTYLVMRHLEGYNDRYTSHLAYITKLGDKSRLEWDLYSFHYHSTNGSFISALFPTRQGPDIVYTGKGPSRVKRRGLGDCGPLSFFACLRNDLQDPDISSTWSKRRVRRSGPPTQVKGREWSQQSTFPPPPIYDTSDEKGAVTEFPMYRDPGRGAGLDANGFTTHAPWSEFRRYIATTEIPNPFQTGFSSGIKSGSDGPKKLCFGLQRNCVDRPTERPAPSKACAFGFRCKDRNFVDRYAVASSSTTAEPPVQVIDHEGDGKKPKGKKKKKKKKSKEECEELENRKSRSVEVKGGSRSKGRAAQYVFHINNIVCKGGLKCDVEKEGSKWGGVSHDDDACAEYKKSEKPRPSGEEDSGIEEGGASKAPPTSLSDLIGKKSGKANTATETDTESAAPTKTKVTPSSPGLMEGMKIFVPPSEGGEEKPNVGYAQEGFDHGKSEDESRTYKGLARPPISRNPGLSQRNENAQFSNQAPSKNAQFPNEWNQKLPSQPNSNFRSLASPLGGVETPKPGRVRQGRAVRDLRDPQDLVFPNSLEPFPVLLSKRAADEIEEMLALSPKPKKQVSGDAYKLPLLGLGQCPPTQFDKSINPIKSDDLIDFYLKVLRVHCLPNFTEEAQRLFTSKLVYESGSAFKISFNKSHPLFASKTLGEYDWLDLSSGIFLSILSDIYSEEWDLYVKNKSKNLSPNEKEISGNANTMTILTFRIAELIGGEGKFNGIKLLNLMIIILQGQRSDLVSVQDELLKCQDCEMQKMFNWNDQLQINALMRFLVDKLGQILFPSSKSKPIEKQFNEFYLEYFKTNVQHVKNKSPFVF